MATLAEAMKQAVELGRTQCVKPTSAPVGEEPHEVKKSVGAKPLSEKAVLIRLKRSMYAPYKLDSMESEKYAVGNVNKHLFEGRDNLVKVALSKYTEVYTFVKEHTVPWLDNGTDLLNIKMYQEFTSGLRARIDQANSAVDELVRNWDSEVVKDLARLRTVDAMKNDGRIRANPDDYPTAEEVAAKFSISVRYAPVPTTGDFRVEISEADKASLEAEISEVERAAAAHVIESMLEPMQRAVEKLAVPVGTKGPGGATFRDSLILNISEVADRMARVNLSDDPALENKIADLRSLVGQYTKNIDVLRESQSVRTKAKTQLEGLISQMSGLV